MTLNFFLSHSQLNINHSRTVIKFVRQIVSIDFLYGIMQLTKVYDG